MKAASNSLMSDRDYPNIVLLVLDSARGDRFTEQEEFNLTTPVLNELADKGVSFESAYSTGSWTIPAHGSLFTGKLPREHGAHAKHKYFDADSETTLAGKLSSKGYSTVGFSTNPWISEEFGFTTGFDEFYELRSNLPFSDDEVDPRDELSDPSIQEVFRWVLSGNPIKRAVNGAYAQYFQPLPYAPANEMNEEIISWLSDSSEEPFFLFVNYMDAHEPYLIRDNYLEGATEVPKSVLDFEWNLNCYNNSPKSENYDKIRDIYDSSISYLDRYLRDIINKINLDNTLLVIAGDHGQALGENNYWGHGTHLSESLVHMPLIVHPPTSPNSLAYSSSDVISLKDLPHLIFSFLGFEPSDFTDKSVMGTDFVIAESFGPHQSVAEIPRSISNSGYRMVIGENGSMLHNLDSSERDFSTKESNGDDLGEETQQSLIKFENEIIEDIPQKSFDNEDNITDRTEKRLNDLGYL